MKATSRQPGTLPFARRVYNWWSRHPGVYGAMIVAVTFGRAAALRRRAVATLGLGDESVVLDLGCGSGPNFPLLEDELGPRGRIIALDYSEKMLEEAGERAMGAGWRNIDLVGGDAATADLAPESLDAALASLSLSAIPDAEGAIGNVHQALRAGGRFVVLDIKPFDGVGRLINPVAKPLFRYATNWHHERDLVDALCRHFGGVRVQWFNGRSVFIAFATKREFQGGPDEEPAS